MKNSFFFAIANNMLLNTALAGIGHIRFAYEFLFRIMQDRSDARWRQRTLNLINTPLMRFVETLAAAHRLHAVTWQWGGSKCSTKVLI